MAARPKATRTDRDIIAKVEEMGGRRTKRPSRKENTDGFLKGKCDHFPHKCVMTIPYVIIL